MKKSSLNPTWTNTNLSSHPLFIVCIVPLVLKTLPPLEITRWPPMLNRTQKTESLNVTFATKYFPVSIIWKLIRSCTWTMASNALFASFWAEANMLWIPIWKLMRPTGFAFTVTNVHQPISVSRIWRWAIISFIISSLSVNMSLCLYKPDCLSLVLIQYIFWFSHRLTSCEYMKKKGQT